MADRVRIPKQYSNFIANVRNRAKKHGVTVVIDKRKNYVETGGIRSNGFFSDDDPPILAVAQGTRPVHQWMLVFLHESCHMDQWIEQTKIWTDGNVGVGDWDTTALIDLWIHNFVELTPKQRTNYVRRSFEIELDCEKRAVEAIKKWNLPIHVEQYIQKANAYVTFYKIVAKYRKWYKIGKEPYYVRKIWTKMPTEFVDWNTPLTKETRTLYEGILKK